MRLFLAALRYIISAMTYMTWYNLCAGIDSLGMKISTPRQVFQALTATFPVTSL